MTCEPSGISEDGFTVFHDRRLRCFSDRSHHHSPQVCYKILVRQWYLSSGSPAVAVEKEEITTEVRVWRRPPNTRTIRAATQHASTTRCSPHTLYHVCCEVQCRF